MRGSAATASHRTIDLTSLEPRVLDRPVTPRMRDAVARDRAIVAYRETRRRRNARSIVDTLADATMACGGATLANIAFRLNLGLPDGIGGIVLGIALLAAGALVATARRTGRTIDPDPATSVTPARVIVLDEGQRTIRLDEAADHRHAAA